MTEYKKTSLVAAIALLFAASLPCDAEAVAFVVDVSGGNSLSSSTFAVQDFNFDLNDGESANNLVYGTVSGSIPNEPTSAAEAANLSFSITADGAGPLFQAVPGTFAESYAPSVPLGIVALDLTPDELTFNFAVGTLTLQLSDTVLTLLSGQTSGEVNATVDASFVAARPQDVPAPALPVWLLTAAGFVVACKARPRPATS